MAKAQRCAVAVVARELAAPLVPRIHTCVQFQGGLGEREGTTDEGRIQEVWYVAFRHDDTAFNTMMAAVAHEPAGPTRRSDDVSAIASSTAKGQASMTATATENSGGRGEASAQMNGIT